MITLCTVIRPGMEEILACMLKSLVRRSTMVTRAKVAVRLSDEGARFQRLDLDHDAIEVEYIPFRFQENYSHAIGLHHCLERVRTAHVLFSDPDIVYHKDDFDKLYLEVLARQNVGIVGVTHYRRERQAFGSFPTVINCMMRIQDLPNAEFLQGELRLRPHVYPGRNPDEGEYRRVDGRWLAQTPIPKFRSSFPNPDGIFDVGCNLWLWMTKARREWVSFVHRPTKGNERVNCFTKCESSIGLPEDYFGAEALLFHCGGAYGGARRALDAMRRSFGEMHCKQPKV